MQQDDIESALARIAEEIARIDRARISPDRRLRKDLGLDSLSMIDFAVAAEDEFGVRIPDEELERFETVGDVVDYVRRARVPA